VPGATVVDGLRVGIASVELIDVGDIVMGLVPSRSTSDRPPVTRVPLPVGRAVSLAACEGSMGARIRTTIRATETTAPISAAIAKCRNFGIDGCARSFPSSRLALPAATDSVLRGSKKASVSPLVHLFTSVIVMIRHLRKGATSYSISRTPCRRGLGLRPMSHTDRERRIRCSPSAFMALSAAQVSRLGFVDPPLVERGIAVLQSMMRMARTRGPGRALRSRHAVPTVRILLPPAKSANFRSPSG